MTEAEWLAATDPTSMLEFLRGKASDRKLRLFACACSHQLWNFQCEQARRAVLVAERFADGLASRSELNVAHALARNVYEAAAFVANEAIDGQSTPQETAHAQRESLAAMMVDTATFPNIQVAFHSGNLAFPVDSRSDLRGRSQLLHDIFRNPFRPVTAAPSWLTSTVLTLARGVYADCAFDRLPILADALQDAGCSHADILAHCRSDGPHVRGCWVVDLLLGKE